MLRHGKQTGQREELLDGALGTEYTQEGDGRGQLAVKGLRVDDVCWLKSERDLG